MRKILTALLASLLFLALPAKADVVWETYVFPGGEGALSISDQPCSVPSAIEAWKGIRAAAKARFNVILDTEKQSRLLWKGAVFSGCYIVGPDTGLVYNIDSDGDKLQPPVPRDAFRPHAESVPVDGVKI